MEVFEGISGGVSSELFMGKERTLSAIQQVSLRSLTARPSLVVSTSLLNVTSSLISCKLVTPTASPCNTLNGNCNASWVETRADKDTSGCNRRYEYSNALTFAGVNESFSLLTGLDRAASNSTNRGVIACMLRLGKGANVARPRRQSM